MQRSHQRGIYALGIILISYASFYLGVQHANSLGKLLGQSSREQYKFLVPFLKSRPELAESLAVKTLPSSWQTRFIKNRFATRFERQGAYLGLFRGRESGAIAHVMAVLPNGERYYLLTRQTRIIDSRSRAIYEPPGGFFNGVNDYTIPHAVMEAAERAIERRYSLKEKPDVTRAYRDAFDAFDAGRLSHEVYAHDANLLETAKRELHEESGLSFDWISRIKFIEISRDESERGIVSHVLGILRVARLPELGVVADPREIEHVDWVNVNQIHFEKNNPYLSLDGVAYPLKALDGVSKNMVWVLRHTDKHYSERSKQTPRAQHGPWGGGHHV